MKKVDRTKIIDYQSYVEKRESLLPRILQIKQARRIHVGEHLTFLFENAETIRYQIQEMMRAEKIVKEADILHEIDTYNEILGDEGELGCCLLIEIDDPEVREVRLREWVGLEKHLYLLLEDGRKIHARYDPRQVGKDRLSSVQYLKFAVGDGRPVAVGADLPSLRAETPLTETQQEALLEDLMS
jgi:hypothetical protein